jgi:hypothetical protein
MYSFAMVVLHFNFRAFFLQLFERLTFRRKPNIILEYLDEDLEKEKVMEEGNFLQQQIER